MLCLLLALSAEELVANFKGKLFDYTGFRMVGLLTCHPGRSKFRIQRENMCKLLCQISLSSNSVRELVGSALRIGYERDS